MITRIGITAGDIWYLLEQTGKRGLSELARELDKPYDLVLMSVGWLVREGHVILEGEKDYQISLRHSISNKK